MSWLFGAGTSVSAGLPSAYDLIWDFKRRIYCSEQGIALNRFSNLSDRGLRTQIQNYFSRNDTCPLKDSPEEYSYYFERAFPKAIDRKGYLDNLLSGMQISFGHKVIGLLMKKGHINNIFTTNFDKAFENTAVQVFQNTEDWYKTDLDSADNGLKLFQASKVPLIIKMHGDYLSEKLKNTNEELQSQDSKLRHILTTTSYTNGIGIMGYSGRDKSVMDALHSALEQDNCFPNGIFWFTRSSGEVLPSVSYFIDIAKTKGIEAFIVEIETFDSAWGELIKGFPDISPVELQSLDESYHRRKNSSIPPKGKRSPMIRLNAIPIAKFPVSARLFVCDAGNTKEITERIKKTKANILAIRKQQGIVGFGADNEFEKAFNIYGDFKFDTIELHEKYLAYDDSTIKGLLTAAIGRALVLNSALQYIKRRSKHFILPKFNNRDNPIFEDLKKELGGQIHGKVAGTNLIWLPCLEISLQHKAGIAYLLLTPGVLSSKSDNNNEKKLIAPFIKELMARWYNDKFDRILNAWLLVFFGNQNEILINAFENNSEGVNASFELKRRTAFSKSE
ncbi:SIR2 family protein [Leeuwenhoekiella marinoflava]|uniref:SIR2 family protein n=1 Tax=Leeuwenhoekiella marinoflava TaxID=988 RepID=UPI003001FAA8